MSLPLSRRRLLGVGALAGSALLSGCQALADLPPDESGDDSMAMAYSSARASYPTDGETHSGWVHIVSDGTSADLTFDARFCSAFGGIEPEVVEATPGRYVLRFEATADVAGVASVGAAEDPRDGESCSSVTRIKGGANVPKDWETLRVTLDDVELQTIERSGTTAELRPLPDPVRPE